MYKIVCECGEILESEEKAINRSDYFECECGREYWGFNEEDMFENECFDCEKISVICDKCKERRSNDRDLEATLPRYESLDSEVQSWC
jgi:hypothetical protein